MFCDDTTHRMRQQKIRRFLQERVAHALKRLVEAMMKYERDEFLSCAPHQRTPKRRGYRNGY